MLFFIQFNDDFSHQTLQEEIDKPDGGVVSIMDMMPSDKTHLFSMQITRAELAGELGTDPDTLFMKQVTGVY